MVLLEFIKEILLDVLRCIVMELNCKIINYLFKINVTGSMLYRVLITDLYRPSVKVENTAGFYSSLAGLTLTVNHFIFRFSDSFFLS